MRSAHSLLEDVRQSLNEVGGLRRKKRRVQKLYKVKKTPLSPFQRRARKLFLKEAPPYTIPRATRTYTEDEVAREVVRTLEVQLRREFRSLILDYSADLDSRLEGSKIVAQKRSQTKSKQGNSFVKVDYVDLVEFSDTVKIERVKFLKKIVREWYSPVVVEPVAMYNLLRNPQMKKEIPKLLDKVVEEVAEEKAGEPRMLPTLASKVEDYAFQTVKIEEGGPEGKVVDASVALDAGEARLVLRTAGGLSFDIGALFDVDARVAWPGSAEYDLYV